VYENKEYDALIFLPARPEEERLYDGHCIVAMKTVERREVMSRKTFDAVLFQDARKEVQAA